MFCRKTDEKWTISSKNWKKDKHRTTFCESCEQPFQSIALQKAVGGGRLGGLEITLPRSQYCTQLRTYECYQAIKQASSGVFIPVSTGTKTLKSPKERQSYSRKQSDTFLAHSV